MVKSNTANFQEQIQQEIIELNNDFTFFYGDLKPRFVWDNKTLLKIVFRGNGCTSFKFDYNVLTKCLSFKHKVKFGDFQNHNHGDYWFVPCSSRVNNIEIEDLCFAINSIMNDLG